MSKITITEALAEIKTIDKRLAKKRQFVQDYLIRQEQYKDPLQKDGGSQQAISRTRQSIKDLEERKVLIRYAIRAANELISLTIGETKRTVADWLVWRREVAPGTQGFLKQISDKIKMVREDTRRKGLSIVTTADVASKPTDVIINVDELVLASEIEDLETVLGTLDGQLSLKNATTFVDV